MAIYLLLFLFYFFSGVTDFKFSDRAECSYLRLFMMILPMFFIVAFRSENVGNDTITYKFAYDVMGTHRSLAEALVESRMEPGYVAVAYFFSKASYSYFDFQIVVTAFIYLSLMIFLKRYSTRPIVSLFFFSVTMMGATMNVVRMEIAIAILLFSIPCIENRKPFLFLVVLGLASQFHYSAVLFGIMYPLSTIKYSKYLTTFILLSSVLLAYLGASFFEFMTDSIGMYESYVDGKYFDEKRSIVGVLFILTINTIILFFLVHQGVMRPQQYSNYTDNPQNKKISISYICIMSFWINYALSIVGLSNNIMNRLSGYFSLSLLLLLPMAFERSLSRSHRKKIYIIVGLCYLTKWIVNSLLKPGWNRIIPYETFF